MGKNKQLRKVENRKAQEEASLQSMFECSKRLEILQEQTSKLATKIGSTQRAQRSASLAINYISESGTERDVYYSQLGRSFLLNSRESVVKSLESQVEESNKELPRLLATMKQFDKLKQEQLDQITELKEQ